MALGNAKINQHVGIFWHYLMLKFALPPTPTPDASQWNIGGHVYFMYISCIFHVVCASFSTLATQKLADAKADSSGIWALDFYNFSGNFLKLKGVDKNHVLNRNITYVII